MSEVTLDRPRIPPAPPAPALADVASELLPWARERLRHHVGHASPNGDAAALDAFGEVLLAGYAETGAETMALAGPAGDHLLACWPGADPTLPPMLLLGHHDTAPGGALADDATTLTGPGAVDGKSGLVVAEMAIRLLNLTGRAPAQQVRLLVSADTLMGSPTARPYLVAEVARAGAVLGLAAPRPDGVLTTGRHGSARLLLQASGAGAIDELFDQLSAVRSAAGQLGVHVNVGRVGGGTGAYDIADVAGAELGVRFDDGAAEAALVDAVAALSARRAGVTVRAEVMSRVPAWPEPSGTPLLTWIAAVGERHGMAVVGASGVTDGVEAAVDTNHAGALGAPTIDGFGGVGWRSPAEVVRVDSLVPRAVLLAALLSQPLPAR